MASTQREASPEASPLKGPAPKAIPEDTSDGQFEDGIPLSPMAGDQAVQFISATPVNGDAKVEIGDGASAPTFVGLGKEELMKYANDPFWVRLRWLLFILFWLLWIAMLVGAIVIIVLAPRCAEKKTPTDTYVQVKAADLIKGGIYEQHVDYLDKLGAKTIVISEALQHRPDEPEAVTDFEKLDENIEATLFSEALEKLKEKGIKILLQLVPNHSGTQHEWFNKTESDFYVREQFATVQKSLWFMQDNDRTAWTRDPFNQEKAYLQQFSGNLADLNFRNDDVITAFKNVLTKWRGNKIDGFVISKASFLVEDLTQLMNRTATRNQPENVGIISRIVGISASGPNLVELDNASADLLSQYIEKGLTPVVKLIDSSTPQKIVDALEALNENPKAVINLSKASTNPEIVRLVNLLTGAGGSHILLSRENTEGDNTEFFKSLIKFQKENERGKEAKIEYVTVAGDIVAALRTDGDQHLIVANFGATPASFSASDAFNLTSIAKGVVALATPGAQQKAGDPFDGQISLARHGGVAIKLEKKEEAE